jgi:hypothetical protein
MMAKAKEQLGVERHFFLRGVLEYWRDALKKVNISLDKLIAIVMSNGLSPLCGIADPSGLIPRRLARAARELPNSWED